MKNCQEGSKGGNGSLPTADCQALTPRLAERSGDQEGESGAKMPIFERQRHLTPPPFGGAVPDRNINKHNTLASLSHPLLCSLIQRSRTNPNLAQKINPAPTIPPTMQTPSPGPESPFLSQVLQKCEEPFFPQHSPPGAALPPVVHRFGGLLPQNSIMVVTACGKLMWVGAQYCLITRPDTALLCDRIPPYYATFFGSSR